MAAKKLFGKERFEKGSQNASELINSSNTITYQGDDELSGFYGPKDYRNDL